MSQDGRRNKTRANAARFDAPAQLDIGPASDLLYLRNVAADTLLTVNSSHRANRRQHSTEQKDVLAQRCSVAPLKEQGRELMSNEVLVGALRRRLLTWVDAAHPGEGETLRTMRKKRKLASERSRASAQSSASEGAASGAPYETSVGPVASSSTDRKILDGIKELERIEDQQPQAFRFQHDAHNASAYYQRDTRMEENAIRGPIASASIKTLRTRTERHRSCEQSSPSSHMTSPLVVTIDIYGRQARAMWAKEKYKYFMGLSDDVSEVDSEGQENPESHYEPTLSRRGAYGPLQLAQTINVSSHSSLQDIRQALVCRMDDFPEQTSAFDARDDFSKTLRYTGKKRETDSCFLIEGKLFSEAEESAESYASLLSTHLAQSDTTAIARGKRMADVRLEDLHLRTGEPYWFLHQGSCEHIFVISSIRALRPQENLRQAQTSFLSFGATIRPLIRWARPGSRTESYALDTCDICADRHACMVVLGGVDARIPQVCAARGSAKGERIAMPGLDAGSMSVCEVCYKTLSGAPLPTLAETMDRAGTSWAADMSSEPWANAGGDKWTVVPALE